ncbi:MAG TPA: xanthine dehydrogenase family protein subunit M [Solirubrobacteraceae bacterium]|nr:xanthine dehydrogenase family protein subunit M [Solirubrobacteraceae bacterium]
MKPFAYERAAEIGGAIAALAGRPAAAYLAGGTNLVDHMKLGIASPQLLVDVSRVLDARIEELPGGGLRIGAGVRNADLAADMRVRERYPALARALLSGASGQLRNLATTGGNLLQRTRCPYFQDPTTPCNKREPGAGCSALDGHTRQHAILGASQHCVATHPSDMAVAMLAFDAVVRVDGPGGPREIAIADLHRLPGDAPQRDTTLEHGELITHVELPSLQIAARSTYRKVRDRASYAFALVSVAAAVELAGDDTIVDVRIAFGGLAHKPWRATLAEDELRGRRATKAAFRTAAHAELAAAQPLGENAFKIPMASNALVATLRELTMPGAAR